LENFLSVVFGVITGAIFGYVISKHDRDRYELKKKLVNDINVSPPPAPQDELVVFSISPAAATDILQQNHSLGLTTALFSLICADADWRTSSPLESWKWLPLDSYRCGLALIEGTEEKCLCEGQKVP
jgi:hypothetical protein